MFIEIDDVLINVEAIAYVEKILKYDDEIANMYSDVNAGFSEHISIHFLNKVGRRDTLEFDCTLSEFEKMLDRAGDEG